MERDSNTVRQSKIWMASTLVVLIVCASGTWIWLRAMQNQSKSDALADYGAVPNVTLTERSGARVALGSLQGKVWVADFIFTKCAGSCPIMTAQMADLQESLKKAGNARLVSFTVDPNQDTPDKLATYASGYNADRTQWLFLTGSADQMQRLAKNSFHLAVEAGTDPAEPIVHSKRFVIIDAKSHIRGYYSSDDPESKQKMLTDIGTLLRENS